MALPTNVLQTVQTYQKAELAWLLNSFCLLSLSNKKFKDFNKLTANLGDTVTFDLGPRYITYNGLVITQQPSTQRVQSLVCSQAFNSAAAYSDQQFIFQVREYMDRFGESAMKELGTKVEADIAKNIVSGVVINDPQNENYGSAQTQSGPYRFYGDGVTAINSYTQLAQALANFRDYGAAPNKVRGFLPMTAVPAIIGTGLQQFATNRNNEIANSWELGRFSECDWYQSNLLPTHTAGALGEAGTVLTLVSTNDPTGVNVTQMTFSGAGTSTDAVVIGDLGQFQDGVSGQPNLRFLTFIGHEVSNQPVQFKVTADSDSSAGSITITIETATGIGLSWAAGPNQNLNHALAAGMQVKFLPSHKAGLICSGDQFYLAMPQLPDQEPYSTVNTMDKDSGASIRHYWGTLFGQNVRSYVRDVIYGSCLVPENCMRLILPL